VIPGPGETQPERTALSWQRTALGVVAVAALMGHRAVVGRHPELLLLAGACALLGVGLVSGVGAVRDSRVRAATARDEPVAAPGLARLATAVVVLVALAAGASVVVGRIA
jgi:putative membrane protein